jgi:hypothetical protein
MAGDTPIADLVENMDLPEGEPNGEPSPKPTPEPNKDNGDGKGDPGNGDSKSGSKPGDEGKPKDGSGGDKPSADGAEKPAEDGGYVADEEDEGGETTEPTPQTKTAEPLPTGLSADLQYVVDRLPVLSVRGKDRTYQVKAAGQLPEDFEFASKREELIFNQSLAAQELKADKLLNEYNSNQQRETYAKYSEQENTDVRHDIGDLQRENELPKFKYLSTDSRFNDDPAVKAVQEVLNYMNQKNSDYIANQKPYRITFRDAYDQMVSQITKANAKGDTPAQKKEDTERKNVSRSTSSGRSTSSNPIPKAVVSRNMEDLMAKIDNLDFA